MGQVIPFITRVSAPGDWSLEERARLAELAERYAAAGVRVEVIYGATEDGDPWCVVKDEFEEILIHVARIGDTFVVHYAVDDALRQGQDLRSVLSERLDWVEERPEVVVPFSRQAQSLLALIVAASFCYETAPPGGDEPPANGHEPLDDHAAKIFGARTAHELPQELALVGKAAQVGAFGFLTLGASGFEPVKAAVWRPLVEDSPLARTDHAGVEPGRFTPGGPSGPIANLEVAAAHGTDAPQPVILAVKDHPHAAASAPAAQTANGFGATQVSGLLRTDDRPPAPQTKPGSESAPAPDHSTETTTRWTEVDTDGDGQPDTRIEGPAEPKDAKGDVTVLADHEAILTVGHGFPHVEFG